MVSIPGRFRGRARRDAAAFYLSQLAQGILTGELGVLTGHETVRVQPTDFLVLEITVTQTARANRVAGRVRWPFRQGVPAPRGGRAVSPGPTGPAVT